MLSQKDLVHNLPHYPTPFVGRNDEINEMMSILDNPACRLLTLVGPGGCGKTRLAVHLASQVAENFADGIFFVPPTSATDEKKALSSLANIIGLQFYETSPPKKQLFDYLQAKQMLFVFDSFEHSLNDIDLISELLNDAPAVKIITTSRAALSLQEEWVRHISGMSFPRNKPMRPIEDYGALALFQDRARRVHADFSVNENLVHVMQICQIVEGLPLAIELATSWLRVLACEDIAREIRQRYDFLSTTMRNVSPRHRSMRAVFDESWGLLSDSERNSFSKLSVFRGGFAREAAEVIADTPLPILSTLVDKSIVQHHLTGQYEIHELLRQYAAEQLENLGASYATQEEFCRYYMTFVKQRLADIKGVRQMPAVKEISANFENIREAWAYAVERKMDNALRPCLETLVVFFWDRYKGRGLEFDKMLRDALHHYRDEQSNPLSLWWLLRARSVDYSAYETAKAELEACRETAIYNGDQKEIAFCLSELGEVMCRASNYIDAVGYFEEALTYYRKLGDAYDIARTLFNIANWKWYLGKRDAVRQAIQESLALRREIGDQIGVAWSLGLLASDKVLDGDYLAAERMLHDMNAIHHQNGNMGAEAVGKGWLSLEIYTMRGDLERAYTLAQEVLEVAPDDNYPLASGYALVTLSLIAGLRGDYDEAYRLCLEAQAINSWPDLVEIANWASAIVACGQEHYPEARHSIQSTLEYAMSIASPAWVIWCLPVVALILANEGLKEPAVELLAAAFTHSASATGWIAKWPKIIQVRDGLQAKLGETAFRIAWERGKSFSLDTMTTAARQFLGAAETQDLRPSSTSLSANRALVDPLSDRELEVLRLMPIGLSNPEIAQRLTVEKETIKKHINHIYSKLGVTNRDEAIVRARELGLL